MGRGKKEKERKAYTFDGKKKGGETQEGHAHYQTQREKGEQSNGTRKKERVRSFKEKGFLRFGKKREERGEKQLRIQRERKGKKDIKEQARFFAISEKRGGKGKKGRHASSILGAPKGREDRRIERNPDSSSAGRRKEKGEEERLVLARREKRRRTKETPLVLRIQKRAHKKRRGKKKWKAGITSRRKTS